MGYSIAINVSPVSGFVAAYRPIEFKVRTTRDTGTDTPVENVRAKVTLTAGLTTVATMRYTRASRLLSKSTVGSTETAEWYFDFQTIAQDFVASSLKPVNGGKVYLDATAVVAMIIEFVPEYYGTQNYLLQDAGVATSGAIYALNACRQHGEFQPMIDYYTFSGLLFLTQSPNSRTNHTPDSHWLSWNAKPVGIDDSEYLSFLINSGSTTTLYLTIYYYDRSGVQIDADTPDLEVSGKGKWMVGVGPQNLIDHFGQTIPAGAEYYGVALYNDTTHHTTEHRFFKILRCSSEGRLHFMNSLGGLDSVTITGKREEKKSTSGKFFEVALPTPWGGTLHHEQRGMKKQNVSSNTLFGCTVPNLSAPFAKWLGNELQPDIDTYIQEDVSTVAGRPYAGYMPVILEQVNDHTSYDSNESIYTTTVKFAYANERIHQRN